MPAPRKLYEIIQHGSETWRWIQDWIAADLTKSRAALETPGLDVVQTESLRQRIAVLKDILKEAEFPSVGTGSADPYPFGGAES
jgi:hypothetical protein